MKEIDKRIDQQLINLTSIRALYQEHLKELEVELESGYTMSKVYELQKSITQRRKECSSLGYDPGILEETEEDFNNWLKEKLSKGVTP